MIYQQLFDYDIIKENISAHYKDKTEWKHQN